MKKIENKYIKHIKGYLDALDDINGAQREFYTTVDFVSSQTDDPLKAIESLSDRLEGLELLKKEIYLNAYGIGDFLEKLLLLKPFSSLYSSENLPTIPIEVEDEYRKYVIFHLEDYIDFAFDELEGEAKIRKKDVELLLVKNDKEILIVIVVKIDNHKMIFRFYRKNFTKEEFIQWFNEIVEYQEKRTNNDKVREA